VQVIGDFLSKHCIKDNRFAVGVSGGADSLALVLMIKEEFPEYHIVALTVDHGLRPTSHNEALYVEKVMNDFGIEHHILEWKGKKPQTGIEEQARIARYNLLCDWCKNNDINNLVIAHHLYDQAETFLMRLQRGSGVFGLSAIDDISMRDGINILRPLLHTHPNDLKKYLEEKNIKWVEDESNQCTDFLRVKMRKFLPILEKELDISVERIALATENLNNTKKYLENNAKDIIKNKMHKWNNIAYSVDYTDFLSWHDELKFIIIGSLIKELGENDYTPEADSMKNLIKDLCNKDFKGATLGGCFMQICDLRLFFIKEFRKITNNFSNDEWDDFLKHNPIFRGIKFPSKFKEAVLKEKIFQKI
jgi:tRNA(Ile)-lysidine synthase